MEKLAMGDLSKLYQQHTGQKESPLLFDTVIIRAKRRNDLFTVDDKGFFYLK